jgi:hypothetical protein
MQRQTPSSTRREGRRVFRHLAQGAVLVGAAAAMAACSQFAGPVYVSVNDTMVVPLSAYVPVYAEIPEQDTGPLPLFDFNLRCLDPNVCVTSLAPDNKWGGEGRVAGLREGETDVVLSFTHPVNNTKEQASFHIRFAEGESLSLAVGQRLPENTRDPQMIILPEVPAEAAGGATALGCRHERTERITTLLGLPSEKAMAHVGVFACEPPLEIVPGKKHFCLSWLMTDRRRDLPEAANARRLVCASARGGRVEGLRFYRIDRSHAGSPVLTGQLGQNDEAQCPVPKL